jgi:putative oxidoreductase
MSRFKAFLGPGEMAVAVGAGLLVLRLGIGLAMSFAHGLGKIPPSEGFVSVTAGLGFPLPTFFAWAAAISEFVGGLLVALGLLTRPAALAILCTMLVAFLMRHAGEPFGDRELAFLFGVGSLALAFAGAGRYSLDAVLFREKRPLSP